MMRLYRTIAGEVSSASPAIFGGDSAIGRFLKKIDWVIDYYFVYMLYSDYKVEDYDEYMRHKWGTQSDLP